MFDLQIKIITVILIVLLPGSFFQFKSDKRKNLNDDIALVQDLRLELNLKISEPDDSDKFSFFGDLDDLVVDSNLNMFVSDWQLKKVWVFDKKGNLIKEIGTVGKGPREFMNINSLAITREDKLAILDFDLLRISYFDIFQKPTYSYLQNLKKKESKTEYGALPNRLYSSESSEDIFIEYTVSFSPGTSSFKRKKFIYVLNSEKISNKPVLTVPEDDYLVVEKEGGIRVGGMPFGRKSIVQVAGNNIYFGRSDRLEISIHDHEGNKIRQIGHPYNPVEITQNDINKKELSEFYLRNTDQFPETWPVFNWFVVDQNKRIWIAVNTEDRENFDLWVFNKQGDRIGTTKLSRSVVLKSIKHGYAFGIIKNDQGLESLVRYKIIGLTK